MDWCGIVLLVWVWGLLVLGDLGGLNAFGFGAGWVCVGYWFWGFWTDLGFWAIAFRVLGGCGWFGCGFGCFLSLVVCGWFVGVGLNGLRLVDWRV